jgi:hypothetical protein
MPPRRTLPTTCPEASDLKDGTEEGYLVTRSEMERLAVERLANQVPNASTMRNAGATGAVIAARRYLYALNLRRFAAPSAEAFRRTLDQHTEALREPCQDEHDTGGWRGRS